MDGLKQILNEKNKHLTSLSLSNINTRFNTFKLAAGMRPNRMVATNSQAVIQSTKNIQQRDSGKE